MEKCDCGSPASMRCDDCKKLFCGTCGHLHEEVDDHLVMDPVERWLTNGAR